MISYGEGYKPLYYFEKNLKNLSKSGGLVSVPLDYKEKRDRNVKKLTLEELEELLR